MTRPIYLLYQVVFVALQLPSKVALEVMIPYPYGHLEVRNLRPTDLSPFKSLIACRPQHEKTIKIKRVQCFFCLLSNTTYNVLDMMSNREGIEENNTQ